jgi:hypothetical protein
MALGLMCAVVQMKSLEQLSEVLINQQPALLDSFMPELLALQADKAAVRRWLAELCMKAVSPEPGGVRHRSRAA